MEEFTHKGSCDKVHPEDSHPEWEDMQCKKEETNEEQELDELVDYDGSLGSSKIPLGINKTNKISRSTTDDVVKVSHQKGNGLGYYFKRYWGESYNRAQLGDPEFDGVETSEDCVKYFMVEYDLSQAKAENKCELHGYEMESSQEEFESDPKKRLVEMSEQKMRDMLEIILSKDDRASERGLVDTGKEIELLDDEEKSHPILNRMGDKFKRACDAQGISPEDILNGL